MTSSILTRFAPSPTGRLHIGHAQAAAEVFDFAQSHGGTALLRIEDIDHTRCKAEYTDGIYEDLNWLGFDWPEPVREQSQHYADYAKVVDALLARGLAYPCALTRSDIKAGKIPSSDMVSNIISDQSLLLKNWINPKTQNSSLPFAIRLNLMTALRFVSDQSLLYLELFDKTNLDRGVTRDAHPFLTAWAASNQPDPVIARRDIGTSYHIAVTHDDHFQGISHVVRGADFIDQTPLHTLIQKLMGWKTPVYFHHPLVTDGSGRKLSKSARDLTIASLRASGLSAADVLSRKSLFQSQTTL